MLEQINYFGMYIGQRIICQNVIQGKLSGIFKQIDEDDELTDGIQCCIESDCGIIPINDCKLILRPFSEMTEDEIKHIESIIIRYSKEIEITKSLSFYSEDMEVLQYLISIGIDVFGLKEKGYAIYESKIKEGK